MRTAELFLLDESQVQTELDLLHYCGVDSERWNKSHPENLRLHVFAW